MTVKAIRNVAPPNYPTAPPSYNQRYMDQFTNVVRLYSNNVANAINAPKVHGSFYSDAQQNNSGASAVNLMTLNKVATAYGTVVTPPGSRVYVAETGVYNIQFSAQFDKSSGAAANIYIWLRINGADVPNSASHVTIQGTTAEFIAAWNFMLILQANDYFELAWASTDTNVVIAAKAASVGPPVIPAVPSVILTVSWISNTGR